MEHKPDARLSRPDLALVRDFEQTLKRLTTLGCSSLKLVTEGLRELFRAEQAAIFSLTPGLSGIEVKYLHVDGLPLSDGDARAKMQTWCNAREGTWVAFDPLSPNEAQRNKVLTVADLSRIVPNYREVSHGLHARFGVEARDQIRVLLYDGARFVGWVGAFREEPFGPRERQLLTRLRPTLRERMRWESRMAAGQLLQGALESLLDTLVGPAFVLARDGSVAHCNAAGLSRLSIDYARVRNELRQALAQQRHSDFEVIWLSAPGGDAIVFEPLRQTKTLVDAAQKRWNLTGRQAKVLEHVIQGATNKEIAQRLGCAENTVEYHVTRILARTTTCSRAELIARASTLRQ